MARATQDEITQMAREVVAKRYDNSEGIMFNVRVGRAYTDKVAEVEQAILATLAKYAPDKLPADPDEELARKLAGDWLKERGVEGGVNSLALYVIKHMREKKA